MSDKDEWYLSGPLKIDASSTALEWGNGSCLKVDQGGSIELGGNPDIPGTGTPYIDFHYNGKPAGDFNTRIINDNDGQLSIVASSIHQNKLYISSTEGWSSISYNAYHNSLHNAWIFPDSKRPSLTIEMDDYNNSPRFEIWSSTSSKPEEFKKCFGLYGNTGNVLMGMNGGNVGIGTFDIAKNARLNIVGNALAIGSAPQTADAALHITSSFGGFDRLLQASPTGQSKPGLNLLASRNASSQDQWWSWGVTVDNFWQINPGTEFGSQGGLRISNNGNIGIGPAANPDRFRLLVSGGDTRIAAIGGEQSLFGLDQLVGFNDLRFYVDDKGEKMVMFLSRDEKLGIGPGMTSPRRTLDVNGEIVATNRITLAIDTHNDKQTWHLDNSNGTFRIFDQPNINTAGTERLTISNGNVSVNGSFEVNGVFAVKGSTNDNTAKDMLNNLPEYSVIMAAEEIGQGKNLVFYWKSGDGHIQKGWIELQPGF